MFACDFHQPVSLDGAPPGCLCEWYGKPAIYHFTVPEGIRQHERGAFCQTYGEQFARTVADSLSRVITAEATAISRVPLCFPHPFLSKECKSHGSDE